MHFIFEVDQEFFSVVYYLENILHFTQTAKQIILRGDIIVQKPRIYLLSVDLFSNNRPWTLDNKIFGIGILK